MKNAKALPLGVSVIYFSDKINNIYSDLQPNKELAKWMSERLYKDAMTALSQQNDKLICKCNVN